MLTATRRSLLRRIRDLCFGRWGLLDWLRLLCCSAVLWYELGSFHYALSTCAWPDSALHASQERPAHVLLLADPQVRDSATSSRVGYSALRQSIQDLVLKRNWHYAYSSRPDIVVFLGDILASWRLIRSDEEYERNLRKFQRIFRADEHVTAYYVPGNNDVGLNIEPAAARQARYRFTKHLGPLNQEVVVRNHSLVMLDAAGLVEEDYLRAAKYIDYDHWSPIPNGPVEFVRSLRDADQRPMALMTHIPLYRPDTASCGPLREKGTIRRGVGPGYQNTLGKKTTTFLLHTLQPDIVFSADDKDYCDYVHVPPKPIGAAAAALSPNASSQAVREVTLKAFSPASDIRHPGFQLLSLGTPPQPGTPNLASQPCFLPDYANVYAWRYTPLLVLTVLVLTLLRARNARASPLPLHARRGGLRKSFSIHTLPRTRRGCRSRAPIRPRRSPRTGPRTHPASSPPAARRTGMGTGPRARA
ncbi:hypothetical protein BD413DRAFT_694218 [Trametes elegans]|nr:hypothetical protein BD413DRAFT_694218 [Trametes elegans]